MWARVVEFMLACWLAASPFIFRYPPGRLWIDDLFCAAALASLALLSLHPRLRRAHLAELALAAWLFSSGWLLEDPGGAWPGLQNRINVGLILAMLALIPSRADRAPEGWLRYYSREPGLSESGGGRGARASDAVEEEAPFPEERPR